MQSIHRAGVVQALPKLMGVQTQFVRTFAKKVVRGRVTKKKSTSTPGSIVRVQTPREPKFLPDPRPAEYENPIVAEYMPMANPGYHTANKGKKIVVYGLSPAQKKHEITDTQEYRFHYSVHNPKIPHVIRAYPRDVKGKEYSAFLRSKGFIPCSIGHLLDSSKNINIFLDPIDIERLAFAPSAWSAIHHVEVEGYSERFRCLIRNWSIDPCSRNTAHIQFILTSPNTPFRAKIPVYMDGASECIAIKRGGVLLQPSPFMTCNYDPGLGARLAAPEPPTGLRVDIVDRTLVHTFRGFEMPKPVYLTMPKERTWNRHVFLTFTKKLG